MDNKELREWLAFTWADLFVYISLGAVAGMYFTRSPIADATLSAVAIPAAITSCVLGMKPDPAFAKITNFFKVTGYPFNLLIVGGGIAYHYLWFPWA